MRVRDIPQVNREVVRHWAREMSAPDLWKNLAMAREVRRDPRVPRYTRRWAEHTMLCCLLALRMKAQERGEGKEE